MGLWKSISKYETTKTVKVRSKGFFLIYASVMLAILAFIIIYIMWYQKKYQKQDIGIPGTTVEMKGVASGRANTSTGVYSRIWDADDLMHSPSESETFFLTTNLITSREQTPSVCPENAIVGATCTNDSECLSINGSRLLRHGFTTGECNAITGTCEIIAWCPVERPIEVNDTMSLEGLEEFTMKFDGYVFFPELNEIVSSTQEFEIQEIVRRAHLKTPQLNYEDIAKEGGIISIRIVWHCDFDAPGPCEPEFNFERLDFQGNYAQGHSYHYTTNYYKRNERIEYRRLHRAFGIRFMILEQATAGRFDFIELLLNFGSTLGYFGLAVLICDQLADMCLDDPYKDSKYEKTDEIKFRPCCFCCRKTDRGND